MRVSGARSHNMDPGVPAQRIVVGRRSAEQGQLRVAPFHQVSPRYVPAGGHGHLISICFGHFDGNLRRYVCTALHVLSQAVVPRRIGLAFRTPSDRLHAGYLGCVALTTIKVCYFPTVWPGGLWHEVLAADGERLHWPRNLPSSCQYAPPGRLPDAGTGF